MPKYISNNLADFEYHDALVANGYIDDNQNLHFELKYLNVHKNIEQNPYDHDMAIDVAKIVFEDFKFFSFKGSNENSTNDFSAFSTLLSNDFTILYLSQEDNLCYMEGTGIDPYFVVNFKFSKATISWDNFKQRAWYELHRQYKAPLCLETPNGDIFVNSHLNCVDIPSKTDCNYIEDTKLTLTIELGKNHFTGEAMCEIDKVFANLAKSLPDNFKIKCCLTCKHGNFCPVGNYENELFCTSDVFIQEIEDLWFYTEDHNERIFRSRKSTNYCDKFSYQNKDYFTYNSFLDFLNE